MSKPPCVNVTHCKGAPTAPEAMPSHGRLTRETRVKALILLHYPGGVNRMFIPVNLRGGVGVGGLAEIPSWYPSRDTASARPRPPSNRSAGAHP